MTDEFRFSDSPAPNAATDGPGDAATDLDLTPRPDQPVRGRSWRNRVIMGVLAAVAGVVLVQALTSARVFFLNVDEAVERRPELGEETFRMQGTVVGEPSKTTDGSLQFTVSFGGVDAEVRHVGAEPSDLFRTGEQVVTEGHWTGSTFRSSQILVKHSEQYVEDNPDRVDYELEDGGAEATAAAGG